MHRIFWCLLVTFTAIATANAQGSYQRKKIQPGFFVPQKELNKAEKLPPFPVLEEEEIIIIKKKPLQTEEYLEEPEIIDEDFLNSLPPEKIRYNEFNIVPHYEPLEGYESETKNPEIDLEKVIPANPQDTFKDNLADTGAYKVRVSEYKKSLKAISEDGAAPMTPTLAEDLSKMDSNAKIWINETFGIQE